MDGSFESRPRADVACCVDPSETPPRPIYRRFLPAQLPNPSTWHFDIDLYLNRFLPAPPWKHLPYPLAHFLGYRRLGKIPEIGNIAMVFWAAVGIFCSLILIELASRSIRAMGQNDTLIIASFGAAAVLEFYAIESPLAQPRNMFLSQVIASAIGVSINKLFALNPAYSSIRWLGGALSCAIATIAMALTKTVHPPAGATALLAVVDGSAAAIGWMLIPVMILGCSVMLATALLVDNIQRRFPSYWWTPEDLGRLPQANFVEAKLDPERGVASEDEERVGPPIVIHKGVVVVAPRVFLSPEERLFLETLSDRM